MRVPPAPALRGLAFLAVRHAPVRHHSTDTLLFQGNEYRHIPRSRMGCPAGGKHLLPPVHVLQHIEREGGKRIRQRRPTPRFRRNECPKEIAAPGRTALHSTGAVRFPVFAGYPSGNPHTPPYDGGCTPPHTKPLFRTTPGEATCCPPSARNRLFSAQHRETGVRAGTPAPHSTLQRLLQPPLVGVGWTRATTANWGGETFSRKGPPPQHSPSTAPRPSARLRGRPPDGPALRGRGKAPASHSGIRDAGPRSGGPAIPQAPGLRRRQGRGRP